MNSPKMLTYASTFYVFRAKRHVCKTNLAPKKQNVISFSETAEAFASSMYGGSEY